MGDEADLLLEQIWDEWDGDVMYEEETDSYYGPGRRKSPVCRYCGKKHLIWKKYNNKWLLYESDVKVHNCSEHPLPLEILKQLAFDKIKPNMNDKINIPDWDSYFMKMVYLVAEKSKDPSTKVGAVLVKDNRIIATGYNGFPIGVDDMLRRYYDRELKYKFVVHAEHNAVLSCARIGVSSVGSTLYTQGLPCHECMKAVIQGGVSYIVVHKQWGTMSHKWVESIKTSQQMIDEVGISVSTLDSVLGINGYMDGKQFSV